MTQRKALSVAFKQDGPEGSFDATFARFNSVDLDGDVTLPGAFESGAMARIAQFGHNWGVYTIGKGVLQADAERCWMSGQFNLKTTAGRDHYESVKDAGELQQFSYGYDAIDWAVPTALEQRRWPGAKRILKKLVVHEVSPVMLGAGIGTSLDSIKGKKAVALSDEQKRDEIQAALAAANGGEIYSGPYVVATYDDYVIVREPEDQSYWRVAYTLDAANAVTIGDRSEVEQTWTQKGRAGAGTKARVIAVRLKVLAGVDPQTLATIAQIDLLADQLDELVDTLMDQFEIPDPDELLEGEPDEPAAAAAGKTMTLPVQGLRTLAALKAYVAREVALAAIRTKEGRTNKSARHDRIASAIETFRAAATDLEKLLEETAPEGKSAATVAHAVMTLRETASRLGYAIAS